MKSLFKCCAALVLAMFAFGSTHAQLTTSWNYRMPFTADDTSGITQTNYQVRLEINTAGLVAAGHMSATGDDMRFGDSCGTTVYPHYIQNGMNSANTVIWVLLPSIPANGSAVFYMYYGNASAGNTSSFATVFANAYISGGANATMTGSTPYDWFQVDVNDTVFLTAGATLTINARYAQIDGVISGIGAGYQNPTLNANGTGPGAGTTSPGANSGAGGGSYGGSGGMGGLDAGDTPGNGGPVYGTSNGTDFDMGSSAGSGTSAAGNGGGGFMLNADYIFVSASGVISMNGTDGASTASRGGGGGAGGAVVLHGGHIIHDGALIANGGAGGMGTSTFNDGGGGGGGGRVKVLYSGTVAGAGTSTAAGGVGGGFGDQASGQNGGNGTTVTDHSGGYDVPEITASPEANIQLAPVLTLSATSVCAGDTIWATTTAGYDEYAYMVNGVTVAVSSSNTYAFTNFSSGDSLSVAGNFGCITHTSTSAEVIVNANSVAGTVSSTPLLCLGGTDTLTTTGSVGTIAWYEFNGSNYILIGSGPQLFHGPLSTSGTFTFVAVADNNGCAIDTGMMTITVVSPVPVAGTVSTLLADSSLCAFDSTLFTANGSTGFITWAAQIGQQGPYVPFGTGNPFNPGAPSNTDVGSYYFVAVASAPGCPDDTSAPLALYVRMTPEVMLGGDTVLCAGAPLTLDAGNPGETYLWNTGDTTQAINNITSSGQYYVEVTTMYGCTGKDTIDITINPAPTVTFTSPPATMCVDDAAAVMNGTPSGGIFLGPGVSGSSFSPLGAGIGTHNVSYQYTDGNGCSATSSSQVIVSACVGVAENNALQSLVVYPNPNNGSFVIDFGADYDNVAVELVDVSGRMVQKDVVSGSRTTVNCESQPSGIYFVRVTADGVSTMQRIAISK